MNQNRLDILQKIESGELSVDEGFKLLSQLEAQADGDSQAVFAAAAMPPSEEAPEAVETEVLIGEQDNSTAIPDFSRFRVWSWVIFGFFVLLTGISAWWMISAWQRHPFGVGFWLSWVPFLFGVLGMISSFNARWLHVRVRNKKNGDWKSVRVDLPVPLGLAVAVLKSNPRWLPSEVRDKDMGAMLDDINRSITHDQPFYVEVDEDDEHVEVFIG